MSNKDGLWAQLDKGANKVKSISNKEILEAMKGIYKDIPNAKHDDRQMVLMTGMAGVQAINTGIQKESSDRLRRLQMKRLIIKLDQLLCSENDLNMERYEKITKLIASENDENIKLAEKIMERYG